MRATFLALSFLHNSRENGGTNSSSHFDEKLSFWWKTLIFIGHYSTVLNFQWSLPIPLGGSFQWITFSQLYSLSATYYLNTLYFCNEILLPGFLAIVDFEHQHVTFLVSATRSRVRLISKPMHFEIPGSARISDWSGGRRVLPSAKRVPLGTHSLSRHSWNSKSVIKCATKIPCQL